MITRYYVQTGSGVKMFKDLGSATRHFSLMSRLFPNVRLLEQNISAYGKHTHLVLSN